MMATSTRRASGTISTVHARCCEPGTSLRSWPAAPRSGFHGTAGSGRPLHHSTVKQPCKPAVSLVSHCLPPEQEPVQNCLAPCQKRALHHQANICKVASHVCEDPPCPIGDPSQPKNEAVQGTAWMCRRNIPERPHTCDEVAARAQCIQLIIHLHGQQPQRTAVYAAGSRPHGLPATQKTRCSAEQPNHRAALNASSPTQPCSTNLLAYILCEQAAPPAAGRFAQVEVHVATRLTF